MTPDKRHTLSPALRTFIDSMASSCIPRIQSATVPILAVQNDQIRHSHTGVLYKVGGEHFVLTAAHKLGEIVKSNIPLYISLNTRGVLPIPLAAEARFHWTEDENGRDVAAIWVSPTMADEIAVHKEFILQNQINEQAVESRSPYVFFGYPQDWSARVVAVNHVYSKALVFQTMEHTGPRHPTAYFDPRVHMLFSFTRDAIDLVDGNCVCLPTPHGISGCGIWQVGDCSKTGLRSRSSDTLTLVGIQHTWFPDSGYVQATRISFVLGLIVEFFPATKSAMSIVYSAR